MCVTGRMRALCLLCGVWLAVASAMEFDCRTMVPYSRLESEAQQGDNKPYRVTVIGNTYRPGQELEVHIDGQMPIYKVVLQTRTPVDDVPVGTWEVTSEAQKTHQCEVEGDTVTSASMTAVPGIRATWLAPAQGAGNIIMTATIVDTNNRFWMEVNSIIIRMDTTARLPSVSSSIPPPVAVEDHGRQREDEIKVQFEQKLQKEIDDENQSSEGEWTKEQERERRQHDEEIHQEVMEYERMQHQEEREREERIRAEILDKEVYDKKQADAEVKRLEEEADKLREVAKDLDRAGEDRDQNEVQLERDGAIKDQGAGSSAVSASLIGSFLAMCVAFLL